MHLFPAVLPYNPEELGAIHPGFVKLSADNKVERGFIRFALPMCPIWIHWRWYLKPTYENVRVETNFVWKFESFAPPNKKDVLDWLDMGPCTPRKRIKEGPVWQVLPTNSNNSVAAYDNFPTEGLASFDSFDYCKVYVCLIHPTF